MQLQLLCSAWLLPAGTWAAPVRLLCSVAPSGQQPMAGWQLSGAEVPGPGAVNAGQRPAGGRQLPGKGGAAVRGAQIRGQTGRADEGQRRATARRRARRRSGATPPSTLPGRERGGEAARVANSRLRTGAALFRGFWTLMSDGLGQKILKTYSLATWATTRAKALVALVLGPPMAAIIFYNGGA